MQLLTSQLGSNISLFGWQSHMAFHILNDTGYPGKCKKSFGFT